MPTMLAVGFWVLVFLSTSNAVNLTDGLDGLASVPSIFHPFKPFYLCVCGRECGIF